MSDSAIMCSLSMRTDPSQSLCGSAWKRIALLERRAGRIEQEMKATEKVRECYLVAEQLARQAKSSNLFYPALNRMAAEIILNSGNAGWAGVGILRLRSGRAPPLPARRAAHPFLTPPRPGK